MSVEELEEPGSQKRVRLFWHIALMDTPMRILRDRAVRQAIVYAAGPRISLAHGAVSEAPTRSGEHSFTFPTWSQVQCTYPAQKGTVRNLRIGKLNVYGILYCNSFPSKKGVDDG